LITLLLFFLNALIQSTDKQTTTVDHADIRGLVTDPTSLRRGACHKGSPTWPDHALSQRIYYPLLACINLLNIEVI